MLLKKLLLFIFTEYVDNIYEYDLNKLGLYLIYPAWVLRGLFIYLCAIILFPLFIFHMNNKDEIDEHLKMLFDMN